LHPSLLDKTRSTSFEPHYVYHPAWAARIIKLNNPEIHIDIASTLHFSTMLSAFLPVKFYDYRPALLHIDNLESEKADLTNLFFTTDTISSLSCMHTIEHIGLGRYGDPIDPEGDVKAAKELSRIIKPGGSLIIVTPVGQPRIEFNAHRIYSYQQVLSLFPDLILKEFSLIPDDYKTFGLIRNANPDLVKDQRWGCGCFEFTKE
jgi:SAM-dependent methyltransferase